MGNNLNFCGDSAKDDSQQTLLINNNLEGRNNTPTDPSTGVKDQLQRK